MADPKQALGELLDSLGESVQFATSGAVAPVLPGLDVKGVGSIVDTGYFLTPDPYVDMARVLPFGVNWQIKEKLGTAPGSPRVDLRRVARIIKDGGYRGYVPIETLASKTEKDDYDPRVRSTALLKQLRAALEEAQLI